MPYENDWHAEREFITCWCKKFSLIRGIFLTPLAQVAKLVDALVSGTSPRKGVKVRVLSWAPNIVLVG